MQRHVETIIDVLNHRRVDILPRGELFIGNDFLDRCSPDHTGELIWQTQEAAQSLGLSLVGFELNSGKSRSLLLNKAYNKLHEFFLAGCINGPVSRLIEKFGFKNAMLSTRNNPALFSGIAMELMEEIGEKASLAAANGFKALVLADDIAGKNGLLFSPRYFCDTVLPIYAAIASTIKSTGLYAFIHSDGDMRKVVDLLTKAGYDCIHPVDVQAGLDLMELQEEFGGKITFMGHIDMFGWDEKKIGDEVKLAEQKFKNGGLILGSAGGLSTAIPEEKLSLLFPSWKAKT